MTKCSAAILRAIGEPLRIEEIELDACAPREVVVRIAATAVCITDVISGDGGVAAAPPTLLGHTACGVVEEAGEAVQRVRVGDRVVVTGTPECGVCYWCARGEPAECEEMLAGMFPPREIATLAGGERLRADGGVGTFAQRTKLREGNVVAVDSALPDEHLALLGCGPTSGLGAIFNVAEVRAGSSVAVVGCGPLGLWMIQGARAAGAAQVIAVEPRPERRALAFELGATDLIDPADGDPVEQVKALTGGRGADYALEAAGPPEAMAQAFAMARPAGTVVPSGWTSLEATVTLSAVDFAVGAKKIHGCQFGGAHVRRDVPRFARMMERGLVDAGPIVSATFALAEINDAFAAARDRALLTAVIRP